MSQYYNPNRKKNLYDPKSKETYRLSRGEFAVLSQLVLRGYDANMALGHTKFVNIEKQTNVFRFFIVPSTIVAEYVSVQHKFWLDHRPAWRKTIIKSQRLLLKTMKINGGLND